MHLLSNLSNGLVPGVVLIGNVGQGPSPGGALQSNTVIDLEPRLRNQQHQTAARDYVDRILETGSMVSKRATILRFLNTLSKGHKDEARLIFESFISSESIYLILKELLLLPTYTAAGIATVIVGIFDTNPAY
jgi:hypothetical protein